MPPYAQQKLEVQDVIGTALSKTAIAAGGNALSDAIDLQSIKALVVGMSVDFGATPDGNVKLEVLTSPDDTNWDTVAYTQFEIDFSVSVTLQKSIPVNSDARYAKIKITNLDSADSIDVWGFVTLTQALS